MPQSRPQVAHYEEYDSDESSVKPGTRKEARRKTTSSRPPQPLSRYRSGHQDGASDSGYSSRTSSRPSHTPATAQPTVLAQAPSRSATAQGTTKTKPVIHRTESQQSKERAPARSGSISKQSGQCDNLNCQHPQCLNMRNLQRRYSLSQQDAAQYAAQYAASPTPYAASPTQYQQQAPNYQYQYSQAQQPQKAATQPVPTLTAQPRPRSGSASRPARPVSFHGYSYPSGYNSNQQGPPPAASAYQSVNYAAWAQAYQQQQRAYQQAPGYGTTPPNQVVPLYPQTSPVMTSPTSPVFTAAPTLQRTYSARTTNSSYDTSKQAQPTRPYSARHASSRSSAMPGAFPGGDPESAESSSESSESEYSEDEYDREQKSWEREGRPIPSSSQRRPSIKRQYATAPNIPTRSFREPLPRNLRSETTLDYISSSDNMHSDRTARAVIDRPRTTYTGSSRSSRRPSVSTNASSNRTKATTMSSSSGLPSGMANMVLERNGRNITYLSKRDQAALAYARHQLEERQRLENDVEAYQDDVRGPLPQELTAENIRKQQMHPTSSHTSGHSRKDSRPSSQAPRSGEAVKIEAGGTVIHVYPGSKVEMRSGEDGQSTFVIGSSAGGKESSYHSGSRSSWSRIGRSRGGETIQEEDIVIQPDF